ncbi:MAG: hypothetical protein KIT83_02755, partial [Bryobacterales bacterium]|nr:hypothetical protein [Bryobacterales bacterium]
MDEVSGIRKRSVPMAVRKPMGKQPRSKLERDERLKQILKILEELHPNPKCARDHRNPFELLVA